MLTREGVSEPADVALIGSKQQVLEQLDDARRSGVTEFSGAPSGTGDEKQRTLETLLEYQNAS
jgi:alkanesulfonate monooxygenase SsuD/methylene tetrahydromethanopterin reductase-like flavin-dependent oxidoreductase (luciferase family)